MLKVFFYVKESFVCRPNSKDRLLSYGIVYEVVKHVSFSTIEFKTFDFDAIVLFNRDNFVLDTFVIQYSQPVHIEFVNHQEKWTFDLQVIPLPAVFIIASEYRKLDNSQYFSGLFELVNLLQDSQVHRHHFLIPRVHLNLILTINIST